MTEQTKFRLFCAALLGCFIAVGWLEDLSMYEDPKPKVNAPVYVDWRTGEWVDP